MGVCSNLFKSVTYNYQNKHNNTMKKHIAVFDGTSSYIIPSDELIDEININQVEVIGESDDIDEAQEIADNCHNNILT